METLTLSDEHRKLITDSGISEEVAYRRGYRTVTSSDDPALASYGSAQKKLVPALFIPSYNVYGEQVGSQLRPDNPRSKDDKPLKYESAKGASSFLDVHPDIRDRLVNSDERIIITEGVRKADAVNSQNGLCLALPGVWNWKGTTDDGGIGTKMLPAFDAIPLKDRKVTIAFDSDVVRKSEVRLALRRFAACLKDRKAKVEIVLLPDTEEKTGLDDFLVAGNTLDDIWNLSRSAKEVLEELDTEYMNVGYLPRTHLGNAERIYERVGNHIAWCPSTGWYVWDGTVWIRDAEHLVRKHLHALRDIISEEIDEMARSGVSDEEIGKHRKLQHDCQTGNHLKEVLGLLREFSLHEWSEFDQQPNMITVGNGTLVFGPTGEVELKPHDPADMLTRKSDVNYNADAKAPFFESTVQMALPDEDVRTFFQRAIGYSMMGGNSEQVIFMAHGSGENLKSTVLGAVKRALGRELGLEVDPSSLRPSDRGGSSASPDKMRLVGSRMVLAAEASDKLDPEFLKRVSGGEEIVARQLHGKTISFVPDFTLWLMFNAPPTIEDSGHGMWRRVRVIPFTHRVKNPIDSGTVNKLMGEQMEGILAWMVRGFVDYKQHGLTPPEAVLVETQEMRNEMDWLQDFLNQSVTVTNDDSDFVKRSELWSTFESWRGMDFELRSIRKSDFNARMVDKYGKPVQRRGNLGWKGVRIGQDDGEGKKDLPEVKSNDHPTPSDLQEKERSNRSKNFVEVSKSGLDTASDHYYREDKNEDQMADFHFLPGQEPTENPSNTSHPFTSSLDASLYMGSYDRLRGSSNPARLGTCGRVPWKSSPRTGGCGHELSALPDTGYIGVCESCHPDSMLRDTPHV